MERIEQPRTARSRRTRSAILDAAWSLIEERGAEELSMEEIAERAEVSRRAIYLHFASRADLLVALMAHLDEKLDLDASMRPVMAAADPVAALRAWTEHLARYHPRILNVARAVDRARRTDEAAAALWSHAMGAWHDACRRLAARLAEEERLAEPWTEETAADMLWALMSTDLLEDLTEDCGWSHQRYAEGLFTLVERALVRRSPSGGQE